MGQSQSQTNGHKKRPSIHSGKLYNNSSHSITRSFRAQSKSKTLPAIATTLATNRSQSALEIKENLPSNLKTYANSIEVLYHFWSGTVEQLSESEYKQTAVLFYLNVFSQLSEARNLFQKKIELQSVQFFGMFGWLIKSLRQPNPERLIKRIRSLGVMHANMQIKREWYDFFLNAFHETMIETFNAEYTPRVRFCMEQLYTLVANTMLGKDFRSLSSAKIAHLVKVLDKLEHCLDDEEGRNYMEMYTKQQFCVELMLFYRKYRVFRNCKEVYEKQKIGKEITTLFLTNGAKCEINVSYTTRQTFFERLKKANGEFADDMFDQCKDEVIELIKTNLWTKFVKSIQEMAVDADINYNVNGNKNLSDSSSSY